MKDSEQELRQKIADNLGNLSEKILKREKPFDKVPFHPEVSYGYRKYYQYEKELEDSFKHRILEADIAWAKFIMQDILIGAPYRFDSKYPEYKEINKAFGQWIKRKESNEGSDSFIELPVSIKKALVNETVKKTIKNRKPEYRIDNKAFGSIGFSKPWHFNNKIYIHVDTGSWRTSLSFSIGLDDPRYCVDIAEFFGAGQSHYSKGYVSVDQIKEGTNRALDLIDIMMPHFEDSNKAAFEEMKK